MKIKSGIISLKESELEGSDHFHFLPTPLMTTSFMIQCKLDCRSRKQKRTNQPTTIPGIEDCDWLILLLLLPTLAMQFKLDRKRQSHKRNRYSASNYDNFISTRSYRSALLITTPTPPLSLVKTSLNCLSVSD